MKVSIFFQQMSECLYFEKRGNTHCRWNITLRVKAQWNIIKNKCPLSFTLPLLVCKYMLHTKHNTLQDILQINMVNLNFVLHQSHWMTLNGGQWFAEVNSSSDSKEWKPPIRNFPVQMLHIDAHWKGYWLMFKLAMKRSLSSATPRQRRGLWNMKFTFCVCVGISWTCWAAEEEQ